MSSNHTSNNHKISSYQAIEFNEFGSSDNLRVTTRQTPELLPDQLLIKNRATSVNPIDFKTRQGLGWAAQENADKLPMVLGYDVVGQVIDIGHEITEFAVGDTVIGFVGFPLQAGAYASQVVATEYELTKTSKHAYSHAALPLAGLTAYQALFDIGQLVKGETVLISGASGGVGYLAVQLALNTGANVIAVASKKNHSLISALGDVTVVDYNDLSVFESLSKIDLWLDLIGGDKAVEQLDAVKNISRVVTVPTITKDQVCEAVAAKATFAQGMLVSLNKTQLNILMSGVENGTLRLNIGKYVNYKEAALAHCLAESGELCGKVVITLD